MASFIPKLLYPHSDTVLSARWCVLDKVVGSAAKCRMVECRINEATSRGKPREQIPFTLYMLPSQPFDRLYGLKQYVTFLKSTIVNFTSKENYEMDKNFF